MTTQSDQNIEQLREAVLGNQRGREVEVDPSGEIRISHDNETNPDRTHERPLKPSKMADHTFG